MDRNIQWRNIFITFYGDWIGRPCDNYYCVESIEESDEQIKITLDSIEIIVDDPVNIRLSANEYSIAHAAKITVIKDYAVMRTYEKTDNGIIRTEDGQSKKIEMEEPEFALCITKAALY